MKIALISPNWKIENSYPPLGLAYIGAILEKDDNIVRIFDLTLDPDRTVEDKMKDIVKFCPEIIGISCMSHNYSNALKIAQYLKYETNAYMVFGGPHPTIMPEQVLKNEFVDFVIIGEGEYVFLKLCQNLSTKEFSGIDGLCYKENKDKNKDKNEGNDEYKYEDNRKESKIMIQPKKNFIEDIDGLPFPARHLLRLDEYKLMDDYGDRMVTIISSRGCPYNCTYCYKGLFGKLYRQRSSQNIIDEIKRCKERFGYSSFYFIDDLFTLNSKRVLELTEAIKKEDLDIRWQCLARVNNATPQMFEYMKNAGCYKVHFGIESGNQNILDNVKKGITLEQVRNAVKYCKNAGIKTKGYFMIGMPSDTIQTMQNTLDFSKELKLDDVMFSITTPFPGTELWNTIDKSKIESLSDAFYYLDCNDQNFHIFYNLSNATNDDILGILKSTRQSSEEKRARSICDRMFGKKVGFMAYQLSKIPILKRSGKIIFHMK